MERSIEQFMLDYPAHLDNVEWLSTSIIHLSALLYNHNLKMAEAEQAERTAMVSLLDTIINGKKMAVSEAEIRAQAITNNSYHSMKVGAEAIIEMINAIKKRMEVLQWERKSPHY